MEKHEYGYARVSSRDQNEARQLAAFAQIGLGKQKIFVDKESGKDFERTQYKRLLRRIKPGDTVFVTSLDRLGRNYREVIAQWNLITQEKQADIVVMDMELLDTRKERTSVTGLFITDLLLQLLSYVAQMERENIRKRQAEGIAAAKERGVHFGNPGKPLPRDFDQVADQWKRREISMEEALRQLEVSRSYFYKQLRRGNG